MTKLLSLDYQIVKKREGSIGFDLPFLKELSK
jgi:hypothetical protein